MNNSNKTFFNQFSLLPYIEPLGQLMSVNFVLILVFSLLWAFFLIRTLWKDYRKEKMNFKLRITVPEYQWLNTMNNFRSNRTKKLSPVVHLLK